MTKVILKWHSYKILSLDKDEIEFKMRLIEVVYFLQVKTHFSEHHRLTLSSKVLLNDLKKQTRSPMEQTTQTNVTD